MLVDAKLRKVSLFILHIFVGFFSFFFNEVVPLQCLGRPSAAQK